MGGHGGPLLALLFVGSLCVSVFHLLTHQVPLRPTVLGQWSLLLATLLFGGVGWHAIRQLDTPHQRSQVGLHALFAFGFAGLASAGYALHQHLSPVAELPVEGILFDAVFVALIAGTVGSLMGLEVARRDRALADLQEERNRFSKLFQNIPEPALEYRLGEDEIRIERTNDAFVDQFGIEPPVTTAEFNRIAAGLDREEEARELDDLLAGNERVERQVLRRTPEGRRWFELRTSPHTRNGGFAIYLDVTKQHLQRQQLQVLSRVLRHNLRNRLTVAQGYATQIRRKTDDAEIERYTERIEASTRQLVELANRTKAMRTHLEEQPPKPQRMDVAALVRERVEAARESFPLVEFELESPDELRAQAHPALGVVVDALLEALVKHNDQPRPSVEIALRESDQEGSHAVVRLTDNGTGLSAKELIPLDSGTEPSQLRHAIDVDLWMANWLVDQFGGALQARTPETGGTVFEIKLNAAEL